MDPFLDKSIRDRFKESISETNIFMHDKELKDNYNLFCVVMDRLNSSVDYLNTHSEKPETENDFLFFITYSCIVLDAVKQLCRSLNVKNPYTDTDNTDSYTYFKDTCMSHPRIFPANKRPTDDKFFEYFRSLSMAHPFETSRPQFFNKNEIQYSPWIIVHTHFSGLKNLVGARIYSNQFDDIQDLTFPFERLKEYIASRYHLISEAIEKIYRIIEEKRYVWKENKVSRNLPTLQTLIEIRKRLKERYEETYTIDTALNCFDVQLTDMSNEKVVSDYLKVIEDSLPSLIDTIDSLNHEKADTLLHSILNARPKNMHPMASYQLEKIFTYLNPNDGRSSNYLWGLDQAEAFVEEFGHKWININANQMNAEEIKLLVRAACYFEKSEQLNS